MGSSDATIHINLISSMLEVDNCYTINVSIVTFGCSIYNLCYGSSCDILSSIFNMIFPYTYATHTVIFVGKETQTYPHWLLM